MYAMADNSMVVRRIAAKQTPVTRFPDFATLTAQGERGEYNEVAAVIADGIDAALPEDDD